MRPDMFEILIERPRGGHADRWKPGRPPRELDDLPRLEPMRMRNKWLNENLAPLWRFLERRVGRDWNDVHAEICATLSLRSAVQKHVLDHLRHMVCTNVIFIDGWPHDAVASGGRHRPVAAWRRRGFYVCPETRRLCAVGHRRRAPRPRARDRLRLDDEREAWRIDGVWYELRFAPLPPPGEARRYLHDLVLHRSLNDCHIERALAERYGDARRYAVAKRQLSRAAIARLPRPNDADSR
jgi:hypothetical protein